MKIRHLTLAAFVVAGLTTVAVAADTKKLIVGKWEAIKVNEGTLPKGAVAEFGADGKLKVTFKMGDKEGTLEGTYTLDGDSFTYKLTSEGKEHSQKITIKKISETEMDTANAEGKEVLFKRVK